ncbi:hypothetical protein B4073_0357 [Bacillus subtilis]|nr:hypothetical protein B4069_0380 [Bacillus subtilis]KIN32845.1 hypothetical protein B4068_0203 [Bacillus subtilis]KIN39540.1 hypothetical protein B4072_0363 [Bacillus subtilis]KIN45084.1 hypothetical protein B4073_0357 [Bacillus subtilis]
MIQYTSESINLPGEIAFKDVREIFFYQIAKIMLLLSVVLRHICCS